MRGSRYEKDETICLCGTGGTAAGRLCAECACAGFHPADVRAVRVRQCRGFYPQLSRQFRSFRLRYCQRYVPPVCTAAARRSIARIFLFRSGRYGHAVPLYRLRPVERYGRLLPSGRKRNDTDRRLPVQAACGAAERSGRQIPGRPAGEGQQPYHGSLPRDCRGARR